MASVEAPVPRKRPRRLSVIFARLAEISDGPVSVEIMRDALGTRGFAAFLVFLAGLNMLPLPPGATLILGLPLIIVSAQMALGRRKVWLPGFVLRKSISSEQFRSGLARMLPSLERIERLIRPRYWPFWRRRGDRIVGTILLVLSIAVFLPIPLGNWLPAFAIALISLAVSERDGILFAIGTAVGIVSLVVIALVLWSAGTAVMYFYNNGAGHGLW